MITDNWTQAFTKRELEEIDFARIYAHDFNHGTDGHNAKIIIAKMAEILTHNKIENIPPMNFRQKAV